MADLLATLNETVVKFEKILKEFNTKVKQHENSSKKVAEPKSKQ